MDDQIIDLSTSQTLVALRGRMHKSICILHDYNSISKSIAAHAEGLRRHQVMSDAESSLLRSALRRNMETSVGNIRRIKGMIKACDVTNNTVCDALHEARSERYVVIMLIKVRRFCMSYKLLKTENFSRS